MERVLLLGLEVGPISADVVLGQLPTDSYSPALGLWSDVAILSLPLDSSVTVEFTNEEIIDGPGADLSVASLTNTAGEECLIYLGRSENDLRLVGQFV